MTHTFKSARASGLALAASLLAAGLLSACATDGELQKTPANSAVRNPDAPDGLIQAVPMPSAPLNQGAALSRIVFASCADQKADQSIWDRVATERQDLTLYIGDNVYGDVRSNDPALPELKTAYMRLAASEPFARARAAAPMLTVWDDHDYGLNDAGEDFRFKEAAEELFDYVWAVPAEDVRRSRPGVYGSWIIGDEGRRVQVIMLDTRYFRSPLKPTDEFGAPGKERYLPDADPAKTMLGDAQWAWLEEELGKPADVRLLVSSVQIIADGHGWEAWRTLPRERQKLYDVIRRSGAKNIVALSGDRHAAAIYARNDVTGFPFFEATSSSLNLPGARWRAEQENPPIEPGPYRLGDMIYDANYGVLDIDWAARTLRVSIKSEEGAVIKTATLGFDNAAISMEAN